MAEERKIDLHVVDGNALDRLSSNRPHQVQYNNCVCVCVCVCVCTESYNRVQGIVLDADPLRYKLLQPDNYRLEL